MAKSSKSTGGKRGRPPKLADPNTPGGRLQALRLGRDLTQDDLEPILGVTRTSISKYEEGKHDMGAHVLKRASDFFGVSVVRILFGNDATAPLLGPVGAGERIEALHSDNVDQIEVPAGYENHLAFSVKGDSCVPVFEEGDIVIVPDADVGEGGFLHRFCVVQTAEGLGYLKRVRPLPEGTGRQMTYRLEGPARKQDIATQQIAWARPVVLRIIKG